VLDGCGVVEDAGVEDAGVEDATEELGLLEEGSLSLTTEEVLADCSEEDLADELSSVLGSSSFCDTDAKGALASRTGSIGVESRVPIKYIKEKIQTRLTPIIPPLDNLPFPLAK